MGLVLLVVMAVVFSPAAPRPGPQAGAGSSQAWEARNATAITALAHDIASAMRVLGGPAAGRHALLAPAAARLRRDLSRLRSRPAPPDPHIRQAWETSLGDASAALALLVGPDDGSRVATARADLQGAGESLVSVVQATRSPTIDYPH